MSLSSQMLKSPLAFSAALYAFQFVVRYLRRPQFVSLIIRAYYRCGPDLCNKAPPVENEWVGQMRRKGGHRVRVTPRVLFSPIFDQ
ncbi:hypothetical protein [Comamonas odontotermitis]|uniref:hypothetical protein n=1 Tax=Comamonas odontotermitis TaxID=379895 RepID=UPI001CC698A0|nr:hypothetical protein [Comamonas odontotermitis]UBB19171.1 hypothetical protein LAD35_12800 [Comamonas odontotermitis]